MAWDHGRGIFYVTVLFWKISSDIGKSVALFECLRASLFWPSG